MVFAFFYKTLTKIFCKSKRIFFTFAQVKKTENIIIKTVTNRDFNSYKKILKCLLYSINTALVCPTFFNPEYEIIYANIRV